MSQHTGRLALLPPPQAFHSWCAMNISGQLGLGKEEARAPSAFPCGALGPRTSPLGHLQAEGSLSGD